MSTGARGTQPAAHIEASAQCAAGGPRLHAACVVHIGTPRAERPSPAWQDSSRSPLFMTACAVDCPSTCAAQAASLGELRMVDDIRVPNSRGRYFLNWVKLRAWEWTEYDALLLLDADTLVRGDLTHLFALPAEFAWAGANGRGGYDWNRGGVLLLRPCAATFAAMMYVAHTHERLQFRDALAEQDFLAWFFRYTLLALPLRYNLNFRFLDAATGLGPGGAHRIQPSILITRCLITCKANDDCKVSDASVRSRTCADEHSTSALWGACQSGASSCPA